MAILTLGRQAQLGRFLRKKQGEVVGKLRFSTDYYKAVEPNLDSKEMRAFHDATFLTGVYSIVDGYLTDIATEVLLCFPEKMKNSDIKLKDVLVGTPTLIDDAVERQVDNLGYQSFTEMVEGVAKLFNNADFAHDSLDCVRELKATRDIYVHNDGIVNDVYRRKAGPRARATNSRDRLPLGRDYLLGRTAEAIDFVNALHAHGPQTMEHFGRARAFEEMWKATALNRLVSFDRGWERVDADLVRPTDAALQWAWSGSEKYLFDFFLSIYAPSHPDVKSRLADAFYRWPPTTVEGRVMISWLECPFWF